MFNLFCPLFFNLRIGYSVGILFLFTLILLFLLSEVFLTKAFSLLEIGLVKGLFPSVNYLSSVFIRMFVVIALFNLTSLVGYRYPVTTTLSFNLGGAFCLWLARVSLLLMKPRSSAALLPSNSPWYLVPFLRLVEFIRILVRPITLCFRLLANIRAGHILLSLICKLPFNTWMLGVLFGLLEIIVALVQSFVFAMLISVYMEEGLSH